MLLTRLEPGPFSPRADAPITEPNWPGRLPPPTRGQRGSRGAASGMRDWKRADGDRRCPRRRRPGRQTPQGAPCPADPRTRVGMRVFVASRTNPKSRQTQASRGALTPYEPRGGHEVSPERGSAAPRWPRGVPPGTSWSAGALPLPLPLPSYRGGRHGGSLSRAVLFLSRPLTHVAGPPAALRRVTDTASSGVRV